MKKNLVTIASCLMLGLMMGCSTVPLTGRKQLNMIPDSQMNSMGLTSYKQFLTENKVSTDKANVDMVKRVGRKISVAVETFMAQKGLSSQIKGFAWEFNLVEDNTPNAWCMPGGKVVFYTGILPYTLNEEGIAVVMGHEIAHAIAKHGSERMSQQLGLEVGATALSLALSQKPQETQAMYMAAFGLGAQYGIMLPYSRSHETEADKMGLVFMAMAGYNPEAAVSFWQRMAKSGGQKPPEFMSTHPADQTRINALQAYMPEAKKYYTKK